MKLSDLCPDKMYSDSLSNSMQSIISQIEHLGRHKNSLSPGPSKGQPYPSASQIGKSEDQKNQTPFFEVQSRLGIPGQNIRDEAQHLAFVEALQHHTPNLSETVKAIANFQALISRVSGVVETRVSCGSTEDETMLTVVVPSLFDDVAQDVYRLRGGILRKFPTARLNVRVRGQREERTRVEDEIDRG